MARASASVPTANGWRRPEAAAVCGRSVRGGGGARRGGGGRDRPADGSRVGFSPDGKWLATTGGGCRLWAVGSWREGPQVGGGSAFAFSPDGQLLAVDTGYGSVRLVDPDTGREYARLE